jgi:hypothetical protein
MKFSIAVCTAVLATLASAKWDGQAPPEPTFFATQVIKEVNEAAVTQAPAAPPADSFFKGGVKVYANKYYESEVMSIAIPSLSNKALAAKASVVAKTPSFFWMYDTHQRRVLELKTNICLGILCPRFQ